MKAKRVFSLLLCTFLMMAFSSCIIIEVPGDDDSTPAKVIEKARNKISLNWENTRKYSIFEWTQPSCLDGKVKRYVLSKVDSKKIYDARDFGKKNWIVPFEYQASGYSDNTSIKKSARKVIMDYLVEGYEDVYLWIEFEDDVFYNLGKFELDY